jgi:predicted nucleotidyltransferase
MDEAQQREVWEMLDRALLAEVARRGPEPVFATISGAHLYGFASPDSDVDLRGAYMLPAAELLGLHPPSETITIDDKTAIDLDWVAHDIRKFARMMTNHNGYVLEQLFSPLVVLSTPAHEELRLEVLETGELRVRRDDAAELAAIREGGMSYEELLATTTALQESVRQAAAKATLPADVDIEAVDELAFALTRDAV